MWEFAAYASSAILTDCHFELIYFFLWEELLVFLSWDDIHTNDN